MNSESTHSTKDNLQVIYEDNHLIVINKRPGDIVQGDKTGDTPLSDVVKNTPPKAADTLIHYLKRNPKQNKSYSNVKEVPDSKKGILDYRIIKELNNYFLLEIDLHTGRHHQIRSQLSAIGCPIKGDLKYGFDRSNPDGSIHLHSRKLVLIHPVSKEELTFVAPPPTEDSIWKACTDN